ncbi:hypothetical protein [Niveispirillum sp.]|uniref:hypothetical protein n=1 Tax=Niveispirillum sp. TaxID=1917217 RepID=UPI001B46A76B|nr:hypothetical protein [Niveispirillum sp.]MBP7339431.1 hypothetical protein [Niveispirillum sp.]
MSEVSWPVGSFPTNIKFAFDYSRNFSSPNELSDFLTTNFAQQQRLLETLRIAPRNAINDNLEICQYVLQNIAHISKENTNGSNEIIHFIKNKLLRFVTTDSNAFALLQSRAHIDIIHGGSILSEHCDAHWFEPKYGWDFTRSPFNVSDWHHAARTLDLEDILDHSRSVIRQLEAEIEQAKVTKETINQHSNFLHDAVVSMEKQAKQRIDDFATAVMDRKALESPGQNWQEKERTHNRNALLWFIASIVWLGLVITGGLLGTNWIAERSVTTTSTVAAVSNPTPPTDKPAAPDAQGVKAADKPVVAPATRERLDTPLAIVFITTYVLLAISIFRFMTRQFQLEQSLADDARQRRTMMNSYLALLEHKSTPIKEAERILVLQVLFRGTSMTDNKDDISPVNFLDALMNALKKDAR